jgi:uncharacterized protein
MIGQMLGFCQVRRALPMRMRKISEGRPMKQTNHPDATIRRMLDARRIAIVGASENPQRPSSGIARYLQREGYEIVPVNPKYPQVMGLRCYRRLEDIPDPVDLINVFRRPAATPDVVRSAAAMGARGVWLQSGIINDEASRMAAEAGLDFVQDRCIMVEHMLHRNRQ